MLGNRRYRKVPLLIWYGDRRYRKISFLFWYELHLFWYCLIPFFSKYLKIPLGTSMSQPLILAWWMILVYFHCKIPLQTYMSSSQIKQQSHLFNLRLFTVQFICFYYKCSHAKSSSKYADLIPVFFKLLPVPSLVPRSSTTTMSNPWCL